MRSAVGVRTALLGLVGAAVLGLGAREARAQATVAGRFTVTPLIGTIHWDNSSALANKKAGDDGTFNKTAITPTIGLQADYQVLKQVGVGFYFEAARPTTRGDYFPAVLFTFGGGTITELHTVSQRVTVLMYGVEGTFNFEAGRVQPYVSGGGGAVTVTMDPQQTDANSAFTKGQFQLGGGLGFRVGTQSTVKLDARDYVFTSWDRNKLYPVVPDFQNTTFPSANPAPPAAKSTVHNFRISLGFSYVPRRGGDTGEPGETGTSGTTGTSNSSQK